ncbi:coiled-coil domain-containing protein 187 isoform X2 [Pseudophryne corroboree]|uniref:coiled-coil domain-containing protein 187 isoform X2 n=1 Tax=Pseudophryne corroboree TaxID=495146 RepID=UPI00308206E3
MSAKEAWERSEGELEHMQGVARAWDSLLEAKHVLQRVESNAGMRERRRTRAQRIRRRLQLDGDAFSGLDSCSSAVSDHSPPGREPMFRRKPDQTFTIYSKEQDGHPTPTVELPPRFSGRRKLTLSPHRDRPALFICNPGGTNAAKPSIRTCHENTLGTGMQDDYCGGRDMDGRSFLEEQGVDGRCFLVEQGVNERRSVEDHSMHGRRSLEDHSMDGRRSLEDHSMDGRRSLEDHSRDGRRSLEDHSRDGRRSLEDHSRDGRRSLEEQGMDGRCFLEEQGLDGRRSLEDHSMDGRRSLEEQGVVGRHSLEDHRMDGRRSLEEHAEQVPEGLGLFLPGHHPQPMNHAYISDPRGTSPLSVSHTQPEIRTCLSPEAPSPLLTPKAGLYAQKLVYLKSRSPTNKLERLKERIREQKRRQDALKRNQTKSLPDPERTRRPGMTRKVCKVTFGLQPTICKGRCHKDSGKEAKSKSPASRKLIFRSPLPETTERKRGLDLYGASAWREGQKLVQQLLGPSTVTAMRRRVTKTDSYQSLQEGSDGMTRRKAVAQSQPEERRQPCHRESAGGVGNKQSRGPYQVLTEVSDGNKGARCTHRMMGRDKENIEDVRAKSVSPKRPHVALNNQEKRSTGKENIRQDEEDQPKSSKTRGYSVEEVRSFMKKKTIERQKVQRENRRKMVKAMHIRREQLYSVLRKQRDAFPPRRRSIGMVTCSRSSQLQPCVTGHLENARKDHSWLHVTSSELLRDGSSGKSRTGLPEDPLNQECSSPLRLRDLATGLSDWQTAHPMDDTAKNRLYPDAVPGNQATELFSQYRSSQERVQAIRALARDLGRRVEHEAYRLGGVHIAPQSCSAETPASPKAPSQLCPESGRSPVPAAPSPAQSAALGRHSANTQTFPESDGIPSVTPTSGNTALLQTAGHSKVPRGQLRKHLHGVNKEYTEELVSPTGTLQPNIRIVETQKNCITRHPGSARTQRGSEFRIPKALRGKTLSSPRRKAASSVYGDKKVNPVLPPHEDSSPPVSYVCQTQMDISDRMKIQIKQQEKDLAALRQKAELEAREAQTCLEEMLRHNSQQIVTPTARSPGERWSHSHHRGITERGLAGLLSEADLDGRTNTCSTSQNIPVQAHATPAGRGTSEHTWDHTEPATDSTSQWSEVSEFYGSPDMFSRLTLEMVQQYLREEELRARHQAALLRLREEALKEKTKAELALLQHQRTYWEMRTEDGKVGDLLRQEEEIQKSLRQEQAEIRQLHNMYKAAHQKRKLLLRQQKEILRIRRSAAHIQQKLQSSAVAAQGTDRPLLRDDTLRHSTSCSDDQPHQNTQSAISDLSADDDVTENVEGVNIDRAHAAEDGQPPHAPEDHQTSSAGDRLPTHDGAVQSNPLSGDREHVTESLQNILTNLCEKFPPTQNNLCNHSQEKPISANEDDSGVFANTPKTFNVPAGECGDKLRPGDQEETTDPKKSGGPEGQPEGSDVITSDHEGAEDVHLVSEPSSGHSSHSASASKVPDPASNALCPSLAEFQKVSAKLIHISESSISDRGQEGQDTESGDSEVFDMEAPDITPEGQGDWGADLAGQAYVIRQNEGEQEILSSSGNKEIPRDEASADGTVKPPSSSLQAAMSRGPAVFVMEETKCKTAPLASESFPTSEDLTDTNTKTSSTSHVPDSQASNAVRVTDTQKPTSMSAEDVSNAAGMTSPDTKDRQRVTETNGKQSVTENVIFQKSEMGPFPASASADLFHIKSFPHRSEGEIVFITEEVLEPIEDALSEILSPVDEKLSYESADLYSTQQELSEELPSLPGDGDSIKSGYSDTEDFPSPPEEMLLSGTASLQSSGDASLMDEIHVLYGSLLAEDIPQQIHHDGHSGTSPLEAEDTRESPEVIKQRNPFLTLSTADDDTHDPLYTFEIGDRVLVKLSKPGTLKFKGLTSFKEGHWAGVALDKAEGDNDGTYEGVKYFQCPKNCGVFVRPGEISHLLFDEKENPDQLGDDHSFDEGPSPSHFQSPEKADGDPRRRRRQDDNGEVEQASQKDTNQTWSRGLESCNNVTDLELALRKESETDPSEQEIYFIGKGSRFHPLTSRNAPDAEIGGHVDSIAHVLATEIIKDCIKEYKKKRRIQGKENNPWSPTSSSSPLLLRKGHIQGTSEDTTQRVTAARTCGKSCEHVTRQRGALSLHVTNLQGN